MDISRMTDLNNQVEIVIIKVPIKEITEARNDHFLFWKMMDKMADMLRIPPFCPCSERPHRAHCPLGFDNHFRPLVDAAANTSEEKKG